MADRRAHQPTKTDLVTGRDTTRVQLLRSPTDKSPTVVDVEPRGDVETTTRCRCCHDLVVGCRQKCDELRQFGGEVVDLCGQLEVKKRARRLCSVETLKNKVPIIRWLPTYRLEHLQGDIVAGITVGLTIIPQSIAYAHIAGLDAQYGLYSSFMGAFVYALFGTSKDVSIGPVAIMSLLVATFASSPVPGDPTYAVVVTLIGGLIQVAMGLLSIGFLVEYISHPVINSFTTASAITIMESQFKKWLGLKKIPPGFLSDLTAVLSRIAQTRLYDFLLGAACLVVLHVLKKAKEIKLKRANTSRPKRILQYAIWLIGTARNAITVLLAGVVTAVLLNYGLKPFSASNNMPKGLPAFAVPAFSIFDPEQNRTIGPGEMFASIGAGFGIIPLIGVLESVAVGKAFAMRNGYRLDADQEFIALGIGNILGSFVSGYPVTGGFSRTAVNSQSGVRTPLGGIFSGLLVILSLLFLTPYFNFIPDAALAAVIIAAVFDLIDFSLLPKLWRIKKSEIVPWLFTFVLCLLIGVEYGIIIGVSISLLMLLYPWSRPTLKVANNTALVPADKDNNNEALAVADNVSEATSLHVNGHRIFIFTINQGIFFPGVEYLKDEIIAKGGASNSVILDFMYVANIDYTTIEALDHLASRFKKNKATLVISNSQEHVLHTLLRADLHDICYSSSNEDAITLIQDVQVTTNKPEIANGQVEIVDGGVSWSVGQKPDDDLTEA